ncbi:hypothetical protein [Mycobacterium szulgai]|uniref:hypothetical protein n=1 Tax=Mycobacterium szulgai TaxID=1787 RepID=UPI0021F26DE4|nr:hypothetical protein [Mycobacterium szulgai]MCV7074527.1 hypothetical protein [Mycobacterium szulgai]
MKTKAVVVSIGGVVALLLLLHYLALSRSGLPLGWILYLGLPITAVGVLFALRLIQLGEGWGHGADTSDDRGAVAEELPHLRILHGTGTISDTEYTARRLHIISDS